jgi:hypothetical protein
MANDTIENQSLWQVVVALMQLFQITVPVARLLQSSATLKPKNTAPAKQSDNGYFLETFKNTYKQGSLQC